MNLFLFILIGIIPLVVLFLIIYIIIRVLLRKNKGKIDYGNYALNILENNTTSEVNIPE